MVIVGDWNLGGHPLRWLCFRNHCAIHTVRARLDEEGISRFLEERGLSVMPDTVTVSFDGARYQLEFVVSAGGSKRDHALGRAVADLSEISSVDSFTMARTSRA
jgi:hypothetical protein